MRSSAGRRCLVALVAASLTPALEGQVLLGGQDSGRVVRIHNTDLAVLEAREPRNDLPCVVTDNRPALGFDFRFHAGYEVAVPLRELAGSENLLTMLFRVTPVADPSRQVYFVQRVRVPSIEPDARGDAYLQGSFDIGEGEYQVDWLMRDRAERVCSSFWQAKAELRGRDAQMQMRLPPHEIRASQHDQFSEEPPVERVSSQPRLNLKVLVNFAPQNSRASALQPMDTSALVSILRTISRDPRVGTFTIVAFNLHEQRVVYRQENVDRIDFPALGASLDSLNLGTIDLKRLSEKHGETQFLTQLIRQELTGPTPPDALVFAGPKAMLEQNVAQEELRNLGQPSFPVFYMNYNLYPHRIPWRDAIGHAVRFFRGYEFTISRPRDLWLAVTDMVGRVISWKDAQHGSTISGQ